MNITIFDLPNIYAWIYGVIPSLGCIYFASRIKHSALLLFASGVFLLLIGIHLLDLFMGILSFIDSDTKNNKEFYSTLKESSTLWLATFPVISIGIGINFISSAILKEKI